MQHVSARPDGTSRAHRDPFHAGSTAFELEREVCDLAAGLALTLGLLAAVGCGGETGGSGTGSAGGTGAVGGSGGTDLRCPELPGPAMAQLGDRCIDTTEVTQAQYTEFLSAPGERPSPAGCEWNQTVEPACPYESPSLPATCVDYCDAVTYCAWAGKRLCRDDEWEDACTNSGQASFQYGIKYSGSSTSVSSERNQITLQLRHEVE